MDRSGKEQLDNEREEITLDEDWVGAERRESEIQGTF